MDWNGILQTLITALVGALLGAGGGIGVLLRLRPENRLTLAEAEKVLAEAKKVAAETRAIDVNTLCQTMDALSKQVDELQKDREEDRERLMLAENRLAETNNEVAELYAGVQILIEQLLRLGHKPAWMPRKYKGNLGEHGMTTARRAILAAAILLSAAAPLMMGLPAMITPAMITPAMVKPATIEPATIEPAMVTPAMITSATIEPAMTKPATMFISPVGGGDAAAEMIAGNLLVNGSFEGEFHSQDGVPEVNAPAGWRAWYVDEPPCRPLRAGCDLPCPENCIEVTAATGQAISLTDGIVTARSDGELAIGARRTVTFEMFSMTPVGTIDVNVIVNPVMAQVVNGGALATDGLLRTYRGYALYDRTVDYWTAGRNELFTITLEVQLTGTLYFEVVYFAGTPGGGWIGQREVVFAPDGSGVVFDSMGDEAGRIKQAVEIVERRRCSADNGCYWARPEFVPTQRSERVRSGKTAQKYFTVGRMHTGGLSQTVAVTPGLWYRFGAWLQGWQCYDFEACCHERPTCVSDQPAALNLQVGIDPAGGGDPLADSVVWGARGESFDTWGWFEALAQAKAPTMTVFTRSGARFDFARQNNDVYVDDASLVEVHVVFGPLAMVGKE